MSTYVVKSLKKAKLLTDPFKLKLLEQFSGEPVTTKQVADAMGEKAPRLYRHVDALVEAEFLELVSEKPKRGTVERYYKTVASRFEIDPDLFTPAAENSDEAMEMVRSLIRETESDLLRLSRLPFHGMPEPDELPMVMRISIKASRENIAALRQKLEAWMADVQALADQSATEKPEEDEIEYAGLLAFYPMAVEWGKKQDGNKDKGREDKGPDT